MLDLIAAAAIAPSPAELPPWVYQRARDEAASVIVINVNSITGLNGAERGACAVNGRVTAVERGNEYSVGEHVVFSVPCVGANWQPHPGPWPGFQERPFMGTERGRVWMSGGAMVLRGFDVLRPGDD